MKKIATSLLVLISLSLNAGTITVTNVNDSGLGSLRGAINTANSGDTIRF
ncbi:MAG: hypothetical protein HRT73_02575 [Flavobacteriales bacterium]|nr:hypothetical protein [Flavobacteriales bacterium]